MDAPPGARRRRVSNHARRIALPASGPQFAAAGDPPLTQVRVGAGAAARDIALLARPGDPARPTPVWFGGFRSDMRATKATALDEWAAAQGRACLRFDYSGHGESGGRFEDGTIGSWLEDALAAIDAAAPAGQLLFVGSSMGGWMALLAARALAARGEAARLAGMALIAPAVDFTEELMWAQFPPEARRAILEDGQWLRDSAYAPDPYPITRALIEEGRRHLLFGGTIRSFCPVHILQGMRDEDVPWRHAQKLVEHMPADPVTLTFIEDGDHRLSRNEDIARLIAAVAAMS